MSLGLRFGVDTKDLGKGLSRFGLLGIPRSPDDAHDVGVGDTWMAEVMCFNLNFVGLNKARWRESGAIVM